ncbi:MAG: HNH endonuclease [bacterium]|nr:HNH endonuclease [bacterium]
MSRSYVPAALRQRVAAQARHRCGYCLTSETIAGTPMEFDHLVPESHGGSTTEANLWLACSLCNRHKGQRTAAEDPASGQIVPLFNPRSHDWAEHFAWVDAGTRIAGLTASGRATVRALQLNRPVRQRARQKWIEAGWHPPGEQG